MRELQAHLTDNIIRFHISKKDREMRGRIIDQQYAAEYTVRILREDGTESGLEAIVHLDDIILNETHFKIKESVEALEAI